MIAPLVLLWFINILRTTATPAVKPTTEGLNGLNTLELPIYRTKRSVLKRSLGLGDIGDQYALPLHWHWVTRSGLALMSVWY